MIHDTLVTRLLAIGAVSALVGTRVRALRAKQGEALPLIVYERVSSNTENHSTGATDTHETRFSVFAIASTYDGAWALAEAIRGDESESAPTGLSGWNDANGYVWHLASGPEDAPADDWPGEDAAIFTVQTDYSVWHAGA